MNYFTFLQIEKTRDAGDGGQPGLPVQDDVQQGIDTGVQESYVERYLQQYS